ncbi:hypothetical protein DYB28_013908 [Aphanomyces astaci]|uniref:CENP-V/GFA domain-containing protein n=1 Tax=Aphanomyces astaci TaxID=112090 RepID=A0A9X8DSA7_APHAT|nr:hypothetical protein DYB28_013908 [Aphanomyces astaci]
MKCNVHAIVPASSFRLVAGEDHLSTYTFNTHTAKHKLCRVCGVQPFYIPRSNPDGIAVTIACITPGTVTQVNVQPFDGHNWDVSYTSSGIAKYSK